MGLHGVQARDIELFHRCHWAMKLRLKWNGIAIDPFAKTTNTVDIITEIQHLFYLWRFDRSLNKLYAIQSSHFLLVISLSKFLIGSLYNHTTYIFEAAVEMVNFYDLPLLFFEAVAVILKEDAKEGQKKSSNYEKYGKCSA